MMTDDRSNLPINQNIDRFSFGSLNDALDELNFLNTEVTVPTTHSHRDEFNLNGVRIRGIRSTSNLNTLCQRRHPSQLSQLNVGAFTKENTNTTGRKSPSRYDFDQGRLSSKVFQSRTPRARACPYFRRKPLYSLEGKSISFPLSNRLNSCTITNSDYYLRSLRSVNSLPHLCEAEGKRRIQVQAINFEPSSFLVDVGLKRKTEDYCSNSFPVPLLTRSKSLEDLREAVKPKIKSLSTDMTSTSGSLSPFNAASLSPRRTNPMRNYVNGNQNTFPMFYQKRIFENGIQSRITSKDMDVMSILIAKLDVT